MLHDVRLEREDAPEPAAVVHDRRSPAKWIGLAVVALVAAGLLYFVWVARRPATPAEAAPTVATEVPVRAGASLVLPDEPLPPLAESDTYIRRVVALLSEHPTLARWLVSEKLVERTAQAVEEVGEGRTPFKPLPFARPGSRAATVQRGGELVIDPASHRRWDDMTATVVSVDPAQAVQLYKHVRPLFAEVYRSMGHPDGDFDGALQRAADRILATPVQQEPIVVDPKKGYVEHRDPSLRVLPGISRQLLLMGPSNVERLQAWVRRFMSELR